jgi:hypothetical protein
MVLRDSKRIQSRVGSYCFWLQDGLEAARAIFYSPWAGFMREEPGLPLGLERELQVLLHRL